MKVGRLLHYVVLLICGAAIGVLGSWYVQQRAAEEAARASLAAANDCLRKSDYVCAMTYAQSAISNVPQAYEGYEAAGDVYVGMNIQSAARRMYELAVERLRKDGQDAMLVTKGAASVDTLLQLLQRKLDALPSNSRRDPNKS